MTTSGRELRGRCLNVRRGEKGRGVGYNILTLKLFVIAYEYPTQRKYICEKKKQFFTPKTNKQSE